MRHRVPNPISRLRRPQFVEHQHFGLEDRRQYLQLGLTNLRVVAVLDLLQQVAIVVEQPGGSALGDQRLQDPHGQVGFADADRAGEQQAGSRRLQRIAFDKLPCPKVSRAKRPVRGGEDCLVVFQRAVLVSFGNVRAAEHTFGPPLDPAGASLGKLTAVLLHHPQTRSTAYRTNVTHNRSSSMAVSESKCSLCESWIYLDNQINLMYCLSAP